MRYLTKVKIGSSRKEPILKKANIVTVNIQNILLFLSFYLPFFVGLDYLEHIKRDYLGMVRIFLEWIFFSILGWYLLSICKSILIFLSSYLLSFLGGKAGWIFLEHNKRDIVNMLKFFWSVFSIMGGFKLFSSIFLWGWRGSIFGA